MKKVKIGQIGIGHNHGGAKMAAVRKFPELFEVVGFAEEDEEWIQKRGNLSCYEGIRRFEVNELLSRCDAILVETDVWKLTETAKRCVDAGKHVHVDKPASGTLAEFEALLETAQAKDLIVQMAYMWRFCRPFDVCKQMIRDGELGEIYQIDAEMSYAHSAEYRTWLQHFSGGTMYIFGSHLIDLIVSMMGVPEKVTPFIKQTGFENVYSNDNCLAVLEYPKATARVTSLSVESGGWLLRRFAVMGSRGALEIKPIERNAYGDSKMVLYRQKQPAQTLPVVAPPDDCRYDAMLRNFYDCIVNGEKNPYTPAHEMAVQQTLFRACGMPLK